jgi:hypothetical protein
MSEIILAVVVFVAGVFGSTVTIAALLFFFPEKVEKWWSMFLGVLLRLGLTVRGLHKQYVLHDIQSRVNHFLRTTSADLPGLLTNSVRLQWVDGSISRQAMIDGKTVVVRLRREDREETNFVHGVCLFVSKSLLFKAKRYLSPPQAEATDLYIAMKLLEREKPSIVDHFLEDYLHPAVDDRKSNTARIFDDLAVVDEGRLLFPIYLRELEFLGEKVFGGRKDRLIIDEVTNLIDFLKAFVGREVGQPSVDLDFFGSYCRFAVVIVGKAFKLAHESIRPYTGFIRNTLAPAGVETIYLLGPSKNSEAILAVSEDVSDLFERYGPLRAFRARLNFKIGPQETSSALLVLRARGRQLYYPKGN